MGEYQEALFSPLIVGLINKILKVSMSFYQSILSIEYKTTVADSVLDMRRHAGYWVCDIYTDVIRRAAGLG